MMTLTLVEGPSETQADTMAAVKKATRASVKKGQTVKLDYTPERARLLSSISTNEVGGMEFWCGNQYRTDWRIVLVK